jgi:hypothetical protein
MSRKGTGLEEARFPLIVKSKELDIRVKETLLFMSRRFDMKHDHILMSSRTRGCTGERIPGGTFEPFSGPRKVLRDVLRRSDGGVQVRIRRWSELGSGSGSLTSGRDGNWKKGSPAWGQGTLS